MRSADTPLLPKPAPGGYQVPYEPAVCTICVHRGAAGYWYLIYTLPATPHGSKMWFQGGGLLGMRFGIDGRRLSRALACSGPQI
eukprot:CAMPEP_0174371756 /NCGR_PEP_ID=MMETSP0811_2-20130205/100975_1 /TAXON_ID=73025 ORGANISM="Eutreptiella gymnastica-like, Strain CCMP1594" /NCGR_SAMPLE_ID=MMETSP0811_2 /ASSEMBLY_ACC=CAM_ASM_000667 /LENGTH=83 /DNA_ID=CAMNT_0015518455 /DNA_START=57 /DNA_END=308 /DNA_ORIENTATION=+